MPNIYEPNTRQRGWGNKTHPSLLNGKIMLLIFQKFTSHWSRLTERSSGTLVEPRRSFKGGNYSERDT